MAANAVLKHKAESAMKQARRASQVSGQTEHVYGECRYATRKTWPWERRVIYKAEVVRAANKEPKDNPRFVVTNLRQSPQWIYEKVYCLRGDVENRIKELHDGMQIGRTSCSNFWGQHVPGGTDGGSLRADAGNAPPPGTDSLCPGASLDLARTLPEVGRSGRGFGASDCAPSAALFSGRDSFHRLALRLGAQSG